MGFLLNVYLRIYCDDALTFFVGIESETDFFGNNNELMFGKTPP